MILVHVCINTVCVWTHIPYKSKRVYLSKSDSKVCNQSDIIYDKTQSIDLRY